MAQPQTIAIDGPVGAGKSVVGKRLAERLGYLYLDTGAMYRAVALKALRAGVDPADQAAVERLARQAVIDIAPPMVQDGRAYTVSLDGRDVTWELRSQTVEAIVSLVSSYPGVREAMVARQREIAEQGRVVMVGRDIGTVVLPRADLKIYLLASPEERAQRRFRELRKRGEAVTYEAVLQAIQRRDHLDSTRPIAPLRPAEDAHLVDTDALTVEQVVERILAIAGRPRTNDG